MCHLIYKISCTKLTDTKLGSSTGALFNGTNYELISLDFGMWLQ